MNNSQTLNTKEQSIATISAFTAKGEPEQLRKALNKGLDAGLTVNEIKEVLAQLYAYCGFPRSLNGINALMSVLEDRKKRGITYEEGKTVMPIPDTADKYERGRKRLETLTGQPQSRPAKGFGEFSPTIDRFLKEHLFADIFDSDVLNYQQRELVTVSALAVMPGVEPQLESHLSMAMNTGLTENVLKQVFDLIEKNISEQQAETPRKSLARVIAARQKSNSRSVTNYFIKNQSERNKQFTAEELRRMDEADDLHISPFREDGITYGTPTWIWSVAVDGDLYVRAYNGQNSSWYGAAMRQKAGRITAAGMTKEVTFEPVEGTINDQIDDAYRAKYKGSPYLGTMIGASARSATVKVVPRENNA